MRFPLSCVLYLWAAVAMVAQDPPCRWITVRDGLPSNHVYWIMQDRQGLMWFGTDAGAARYDGSHFEVFNSNNGAADNEVLKVIEDSRGRVWFLSLNGELSYWAEGRMHNAQTDPVLARVQLRQGISSFLEHTDGSLWFGGYAQDLVRLSPDLAHSEVHDLNVPGQPRGAIQLFPGQGSSPQILSGDGIGVMQAGHLTTLTKIPQAPFASFSGMLPGVGIVVSTPQGLAALKDVRTPLPISPEMPFADHVRWFSNDRSGALWWSMLNGGLIRTRWDGSVLRADPPIFKDERVVMLYEDKDGDHWISTATHGVGFMTRQQRTMRFHPTSTGPGLEGILSIFLTQDGELLCGTDKGRLLRSTAAGLVEPNGSERFPENGRLMSITGRGERIWIALDHGVQTFVNAPTIKPEPVFWKLADGTMSRSGTWNIKAVALGPQGQVVGSLSGITPIQRVGQEWVGIIPADMANGPTRIYAPFFDARGDLWFDRDNILHQLHDGRDIEHSGLSDILRVRISDIVAIDDSTLAVGSAGSGIAILRNGRLLRRLMHIDGLSSDMCRKMAVRNHHLLVATDNGISIVPLPLDASPIRTWSMSNGLPTNDIYCVEGDSVNVYVGSAEGLIVLPYSVEQRAGPPPQLAFSELSYADTSFRPLAAAEIPFGTGRVTVKAFTPWFGDPALLEYTFRTARDAPWQTCANGLVTLASWGSGELVVEMRARMTGSDWSAPIALSLYIPPPWYQRTTVQVLAVVLVILCSASAIHLLLRRRYRRTLQRLEKERALSEERRRIAEDVHDDLGADLSHLLMMARLAKEGSTLSMPSLAQVELIGDRMVQKIDDIVWSLDPRSDTVNATLEHIHQQTGTQCERMGIAFRSSIGTDPRKRQLGAQERRDLQLAMKELISNALKHAHPQQIELLSSVNDAQLHIELGHDQGEPGPPRPARNGNGHGLDNIRRRLARHGGSFSGPLRTPDGSLWTVVLPLTDDRYPTNDTSS